MPLGRPRFPDMYCARCGACARRAKEQRRHLQLVNKCLPCRPDLSETVPCFTYNDPMRPDATDGAHAAANASVVQPHPELMQVQQPFSSPEIKNEGTDFANSICYIQRAICVTDVVAPIVGEDVSPSTEQNGAAPSHDTADVPPSDAEDDDAPSQDTSVIDSAAAYVVGDRIICKTTHVPPMVSVYDLIAAACDSKAVSARRTFASILSRHPAAFDLSHKFPSSGRKLPVTDAAGAVLILNTLTGRRAKHFRRHSGKTIIRAMGGDESALLQRQVMPGGPAQVNETPDGACADVLAEYDVSDPAIAPFFHAPDYIMPLPPDKPGVYFCLVRPSSARMLLDKPIPAGKVLIGFGYSAISMKGRVVAQNKETGYYGFRDCFVTARALQLETFLKELLGYQNDIEAVKGKLVKTGDNRVEFFLANAAQYTNILEQVRAKMLELDTAARALELRKLELEAAMEKDKAAQMAAAASKAQTDLFTTVFKAMVSGELAVDVAERLLGRLPAAV